MSIETEGLEGIEVKKHNASDGVNCLIPPKKQPYKAKLCVTVE